MSSRMTNLRNQFFIGIKTAKIQRMLQLNRVKTFTSPFYRGKSVILPTAKAGLALKHMSFEQFKGPVTSWQNTIYVPGADAAIYGENPNGWFLICKDNKVIGSCASMNKANHTSWLGYFFINEFYRNQGYGFSAFDTVMQYDRSNNYNFHTFVCSETLVPMYQTRGFIPGTFDSIYRSQACSQTLTGASETNAISITENIYSQVLDYDKAVQLGYDRHHFLNGWINKPGTEMQVAWQDQKIVGYCITSDFIYPTEDGVKLHRRMAPLYADSTEIADQLLKSVIQHEQPASLFTDADGNNPQAAELLISLGIFNLVAKFIRMIRPKAPDFYDHKRVISPAFYGTGA
jgi:hypothetical protein